MTGIGFGFIMKYASPRALHVSRHARCSMQLRFAAHSQQFLQSFTLATVSVQAANAPAPPAPELDPDEPDVLDELDVPDELDALELEAPPPVPPLPPSPELELEPPVPDELEDEPAPVVVPSLHPKKIAVGTISAPTITRTRCM